MKQIHWKLYFKKGILQITILAILLIGCGSQTTIPLEDDSSKADISHVNEEETQFAQITLLDTKPKLEENKLLYGKLQITLPDNVTIEEQKPENDMRVIDFVGMEKSKNGQFPPRVWLAYYHATYQDKWELASGLLDILPDTNLYFYDRLGDNLHYFFTYEKPGKNGYIMVYGEDICIIEEIAVERDYSFGKLLVNDEVHWENSIQQIDVRDSSADYADLCKIKADKDCTLFVKQSVKNGVRETTLFQDGRFDASIMEFSVLDYYWNIKFEDYNFDGCPDMIVSNEKIYLWNADKKTYEAAQIPTDFSGWSGNGELYPETQTIWGYGIEHVKDADGETSWDRFDHIEIFWKWEETALVKERECVAQVREENVRIFAYEDSPEKMLFDETFTVEDWEENTTAVQKRFQQFYAGMVPEGKRSKYLHTIDYEQERQQYIPQSLLDKITKAMLDGTVAETLAELQNDKELTNDEIDAIAKDNLELRRDVLVTREVGNYIVSVADGDNDGMMDLIVETYYDKMADYNFYQGKKDGTFQKTQSDCYPAERLDILSYEGKNYLCKTHYGYDGKKDISLKCYVNGAVAETVWLTFFPEYDIRLAECAEDKYRAFAEDVLKNAVTYKEKIDEGKNIDGSSEEKISKAPYQHLYQCDLNNDDALEQYNKSIWARGDLEYLNFLGEGKGIEPVSEIMQSENVVMMWVEPFEKRNIVNIISLARWEDFEITGYLINGMEYKQLYRITANAVARVRQERYYN